MRIPFTQYLLPDGRKKSVSVDRSPRVNALAHALIDKGFVFECEVLSTGQVSVTISDGEDDVEIKVVRNDPDVGPAVDAMVKRLAEKEGICC